MFPTVSQSFTRPVRISLSPNFSDSGDKELKSEFPHLRIWEQQEKSANLRGIEELRAHVPLRGLGTLGAGVQRHIRSLVALLSELAVLGVRRLRSSIR
jgi:hypothetical protein